MADFKKTIERNGVTFWRITTGTKTEIDRIKDKKLLSNRHLSHELMMLRGGPNCKLFRIIRKGDEYAYYSAG